MFDAGSTGSSPLLLLAASLFLGVAVGIVAYLLVRSMGRKARPVAAIIGDAQLRIRRERAHQDSTLFGFVMSLMPVVVPLSRQLPLDSLRSSLATRYARAGWPGGLNDDELIAVTLLVGVVICIPVLLVLVLIKPLAAPFGLIALLFGPGLVSMSLNSQGDKRDLAISRTLPFALDLLVLTMRAGASLTIAMERVVIDYSHHPIGVEFQATLTDIEVGVTTRQAFENLAQRVPLPIVKSFVDDLIQSEELGRPIADTLERLADRVRVRRVQDAVDTAGKAKVLVLVPGMLVLAATIVVLFAPFIVRYFYGGYTNG